MAIGIIAITALAIAAIVGINASIYFYVQLQSLKRSIQTPDMTKPTTEYITLDLN